MMPEVSREEARRRAKLDEIVQATHGANRRNALEDALNARRRREQQEDDQ